MKTVEGHRHDPGKSRLDIAEFLAQLAERRDSLRWILTSGCRREQDRRAAVRLWIRATGAREATDFLLDPIQALQYVRSGEHPGKKSWLEAASEIGLRLEDAGDLFEASNDLTWKTVHGRREPDLYLRSLRNDILDAVGIHAVGCSTTGRGPESVCSGLVLDSDD